MSYENYKQAQDDFFRELELEQRQLKERSLANELPASIEFLNEIVKQNISATAGEINGFEAIFSERLGCSRIRSVNRICLRTLKAGCPFTSVLKGFFLRTQIVSPISSP
jgi:hypothetical protein